jgi:hypothetical protein
MISIQDTIKDHSLVVNNGSGVLVQPMTKDYSYVLTAKHVIQNDKNIPENGIMPIECIVIYTSSDQMIEARFVYTHPILDLAIIMVDYKNASIRLDESNVVLGESLIIFGYPNCSTKHRNEKTTRRDWIETYTLDVLDVTSKSMKLRVTEDVQLSDFEGFSGGGFFKILDGHVYLVGIDYGFLKSGQYVNRIIGIPIVNINTIITEENLELVRPAFFNDFIELKPDIFKIENCISPVNVKKATDIIKINSDGLLKNCKITPAKVLDQYKELINNSNSPGVNVEDKEFWVAFLEFLHVEELISDSATWDDEFLSYINRTYKFVYIDSRQGWMTKLPHILSTNVDHLRVGGRLLLVEFGPMPESPDQLNYYRDNIPSNVADAIEEESIAHVGSMVKKSISIIHLPKLHENCIARREDEFDKLNKITHREQIKNLMIEGYSKYLADVEVSYE